jgi:hypothetical protein
LILYVFNIRCYSNTVKHDFVVNIFYLNMMTVYLVLNTGCNISLSVNHAVYCEEREVTLGKTIEGRVEHPSADLINKEKSVRSPS